MTKLPVADSWLDNESRALRHCWHPVARAADLASYLLFDGLFADELIELGRSDARARRDELEAFLYGS